MKPFYLLIISILCFSVLLTGAKNADKNFPLFENTCGKCHKLERIFVIKKTTTGWNKTVDWMRRKNKNGFSQKDADKIKIHINNTHAYYTEQLFKQKCAECHPLDKITSLRLPAAQWHNLVLREQAKAITWIALDEAQDIADFLAKKFSRPETEKEKAQAIIRQAIEKKCLRCHTHKTVFKTILPADDWKKTNSRMRQKAPSLINETDIEQISAFLAGNNPLEEWE